MLFRNLLIPVLPNEELTPFVKNALEIANANSSFVFFLSVIEDMDELKEISKHSAQSLNLIHQIEKERQSQLESLIEIQQKHFPNVHFHSHVAFGIPFIEIIKHARQNKSDYILIDSHRNNKKHPCQRGSTTLHLMRKSEIPIWSLGTEHHNSKQSVAAIDLSESTSESLYHKVISNAFAFCQETHSQLTILNVWQLESEGYLRKWSGYDDHSIGKLIYEIEQERLQTINKIVLNTLGKENFDKVNIKILYGDVRDKLSEYVNEINADQIFMGSMSRTGIAGYFIGNKAEYWLSELAATAITFKPDEFTSPVS